MISLIPSNKEMKYVMKILKYLKESGLLKNDVRKTIENEVNKQKQDFLACC